MAMLLHTGFEAGTTAFFDYTTGGVSIVTWPVRNGNYALRLEGASVYRNLQSTASEVYWRCGIYPASGNYTDFRAVYVCDGDTRHIGVGADSYWNVRRGNTVIASGPTVLFNRWYLLEARVVIHNTLGIVQVKLDGTTIFDLTNIQTQNGGSAQCNRVTWTTYPGTVGYFDDFAIVDTSGTRNNSWIGNGRSFLMVPNAAGDSTMFTPTPTSSANYQCVDETPPNGDTDFVQATVTGQNDLYNLTDTSLWASSRVNSITAIAFCRSGVGDTAQGQVGIKSGQTMDWGQATVLGSDVYKMLTKMYETNPDTGQPWTPAELDALQVGVRSS